MGNLNDYFRAADDGAAANTGQRLGGPLTAGEDGEPPFDGVDAKGIDATVTLGKLVALAGRVDWSVELVSQELLFPPTDELPGWDGPWVSRLSDQTRDALAEIDGARSGELAQQWTQIEEFFGRADAGTLQSVISRLAALARRAHAAGEHLYSWSSL
jgi:hypothetical protein